MDTTKKIFLSAAFIALVALCIFALAPQSDAAENETEFDAAWDGIADEAVTTQDGKYQYKFAKENGNTRFYIKSADGKFKAEELQTMTGKIDCSVIWMNTEDKSVCPVFLHSVGQTNLKPEDLHYEEYSAMYLLGSNWRISDGSWSVNGYNSVFFGLNGLVIDADIVYLDADVKQGTLKVTAYIDTATSFTLGYNLKKTDIKMFGNAAKFDTYGYNAGVHINRDIKLDRLGLSQDLYLGMKAANMSQFNVAYVISDTESFMDVGDGEFVYCGDRDAVSVTVPSTVTALAKGAFSGCSKLESVTFEEGLTAIGDSAFYNCFSLKSVVLPGTVKTVGNEAFRNCYSLQSVSFPASLESLGSMALSIDEKYVGGLTSVVFHNGTAPLSIAYGTFRNQSALESIELPANVSEIKGAAFLYCASLKTVGFLAGEYQLKSIDSMAFQGSGVKDFSLPAAELTDFEFILQIPDVKIVYLTENPDLSVIGGITYFKDPEGGLHTIMASADISGELTFVAGTVEISQCLFENREITKVTIPKTVTVIGYGAFRNCPVESIVFEEGSVLESILDDAFMCSRITELKLPASVTEIGGMAFIKNESLKSVEFGSAQLSIGDRAFSDCTVLSEVVFKDPEVALSIGNMAFAATALKTFDVPAKTVAIGALAFDDTEVSELSIPATVTQLTVTGDMSGKLISPFSDNITKVTIDAANPAYMEKDGAIYMKADGSLMIIAILSSVTKYVMPDEVVYATGAFVMHKNLQEVVFNAAISEAEYGCLNEYTFFGCTSLKTVDLSKTTYVEIGGCAFTNSAVEKVIMPATLNVIYEEAFGNCKKLSDIDFSRCTQLMAILEGAFVGCESLKVLSIPDTLDPMESGIFMSQIVYGCDNLEQIKFLKVSASPCYSSNAAGTVVYCDVEGMKFYDYIMPGFTEPTEEHGKVLNIPADVNTLLIPEVLSVVDWITVDSANASFAAVDGVLYDKALTTLMYIPKGVTSVNAPSTVSAIGGDIYGMGDINPFGNALALKEFKLIGAVQDIEIGFIPSNPVESITVQTTGSIYMYSGFGFMCPNVKNVSIEAVYVEGTVCNGSAGYNLKMKLTAGSFQIDGGVRNLDITCTEELDVPSMFAEKNDFSKLRMTVNGSPVDVVSSVCGHTVTFSSDIPGFEVTADQIYKERRGGYIVYTYVSDASLTYSDITVEGAELTATGIKVPMGNSDVTVTVSERIAEKSVTVTFDGNGCALSEELVTLSVGEGRTISPAELSKRAAVVSRDGYTFGGWFTDDKMTKQYNFTPVSEDSVLIAKWVVNDGYTVLFDGKLGLFEAYTDSGSLLFSGDKVLPGTVLTLRAEAGKGVDFFGWNIVANGICTYVASDYGDYEVTVDDNVYIYPQLRTYATSNVLINVTDLPTAVGSNLETLWVKQYPVEGNAMAPKGQPSVPLIIDDKIYIRSFDDLTMLDLRSGELLKSITTKGTTSAQIFHYLGYGNGVILDFNTAKAYDADLNFLYDMPLKVNAAFYDEAGSFIGLTEDGMVRFDAKTGVLYKEGAWAEPIECGWHNLYGATSSPVVIGDWMYYAAVCGASGDGRAIEGVNVLTGETTQYKIDRITELYYDDGWLTAYQHKGTDYLFLTCYNKGQFGPPIGDTLRGTVNCVQLNEDGTINQDFDRWMYVKDPMALSAMVVVDGRGYVYANGLYVLDIAKFLDAPQSIWDGSDDFRLGYGIYGRDTDPDCFILYKEDGPKGVHGSIVTSTAYKDTTGKVYIYVLPYSGAQTVYTYCDWEGKTAPSGVMKGEEIQYDYGTQAVRIGANGEMVWYTDSGALYCMKPVVTSQYDFVMHSGDDLIQVTVDAESLQEALASALRYAYPGSEIDGLSVDGKVPSVYVKIGDDWIAKDPESKSVYGYGLYFVSDTLVTPVGESLDMSSVDCLYYADVMGQRKGMTLEQILLYPMMDLEFVKNQRPVTGLDIGEDVTVHVDDTMVFVPQFTPGNVSLNDVVWSVDNEDVATVDQYGRVTFLKDGTVTVTATAVDGSGVSDSCTVTVEKIQVGYSTESYQQSLTICITLIMGLVILVGVLLMKVYIRK